MKPYPHLSTLSANKINCSFSLPVRLCKGAHLHQRPRRADEHGGEVEAEDRLRARRGRLSGRHLKVRESRIVTTWARAELGTFGIFEFFQSYK